MPSHLPDTAHTARSDMAACRALLRGGSKTFFAASYLLPPSVGAPATALYAFCRLADDAVDLHGGRVATLARLRERLERVYDGRPLPLSVDRAFTDVVHRFAIPRALPEALLEGLEWDATGRRYQDLSELRAYAARVAGAVGAMMSILMGARDPHTLARACDLGVAMQLTNIARDVGEDGRAGRIYLPLCWLRDAGIDPDAWLARPVFNEAIGAAVQRLLSAADILYERSSAGVARLPITCQTGIHAARILYAEIGRQVEQNCCDSVSRRAVVPSSRKLVLLARAITATMVSRPCVYSPALEEAHFLVDAIVEETAVRSGGRGAGKTGRGAFAARAIWLIDLFERLERLAQLERNGSH